MTEGERFAIVADRMIGWGMFDVAMATAQATVNVVLEHLKKGHERGEITDQEYQDKKKNVFEKWHKHIAEQAEIWL